MPLVLVHGSKRIPLVRDVSVGSGNGCDLSIDGLSPEHARIAARGDRIVITPGPDSLVRVGGVEVETPRWLHVGDSVLLGAVELALDLDETELPLRTAEIALAIVRRLERARVPLVHVVEGPELGAELALADEGKPQRVGRAPTCALVLSDPTVSREHVRIARKGDQVFVADMDAPRGAFLGEARLAPGLDAEWSPKLALRIGKTVLRLQLPDSPERIVELAERFAPPEPKEAEVRGRAEPVVPAPSLQSPDPVPSIRTVTSSPIVEAPPATPAASSTPVRPLPAWLFVVAFAAIALAAVGLLYWILR